jgi:hypothetical protein
MALVGLVFAADVMVPEVTEIRDAKKLLVTFARGEEGEASSFKIRAGEEQEFTRQLPSEGIELYKLGFIAATAEEGAIEGFSLVTWKPAPEGAERTWPQLREMAGSVARIRGADALLLRQLPAEAEADADKPAPWGFELISFKRLESAEDEENIIRAKKEVIEEGGTRLVEDRRFPLPAPAAPPEGTCYGVLLIPVWKEAGKILDGFDARLVSTTAREE